MRNISKFVNAAVIGATLLCSVLPPSANAATITIQGTNTQGPANCIPFGCPGLFGPFMGFIYKTIPAFTLNAGDILAFDLGRENDRPLSFDIALSATTVNGGTTDTGFTQVVTNGTPADPNGDSTQGNYELAFTIGTDFTFPGGGLIVRLRPTGGSLADFTTTQVLMSASSTDPSGFFVARFFSDTDGVAPFPQSDNLLIGNFRIITNQQVPEPASLVLLGLGLAGLGLGRRGSKKS